MTLKDKKIQDLRRRVLGLEEEIRLAVEACRICRLCRHADEECTPTGNECRPEWRGRQ